MGWKCEACGTENAASAAFCSMCKQVPGRRTRPPASGIAIDEAALRPASVRPPAPRAAPVEPQDFDAGSFDHVSIAEDGSALVVRWSTSRRGRVRAVFVAAIGTLFLYAARASGAFAAGTIEGRTLGWFLVGMGTFLVATAVLALGRSIEHRFDPARAEVVRTHAYAGAPLWQWRATIERPPAFTIEPNVTRGRYGTRYVSHTLRLATSRGATSIMRGEDERSAERTASAIRAHVGR